MSRVSLIPFDLKAARKRRGLSQTDVAKILCAKQPSVSRWETEGTLPEVARKAWDLHWQLEDSKHVTKETKRRSTKEIPANKMENPRTSNSRVQRGGDSRVVGRRRRSGGYTAIKSESQVEMAGIESASNEDATG